MPAASTEQLRELVKIVDDFLTVRSDVLSRQAEVYASGDPELIADFESFMGRSNALKASIEKTVGAWNAAKMAWGNITDKTSAAIGDAIDWFRETFTDYEAAPGIGSYHNASLAAFGAIQVPAAAWVAGISASAFLLWRMGKGLMTRIDAIKISRERNIPYDQALIQADKVGGMKLFTVEMAPLYIGALAAAYFLWFRNK